MKKLQYGFSIITAIFLLVVLAVLGAGMLMFSNAQQQSSALDLLGSRAYQAARAGMEWAAYQIINNPTPATAATCAQTIAQGGLKGTLASFTVTVTCTPTAITGDTISYIYYVTSVACTLPNAAGNCPGIPGGNSYVERAISSKFGK